jgi:hypothetical protein
MQSYPVPVAVPLPSLTFLCTVNWLRDVYTRCTSAAAKNYLPFPLAQVGELLNLRLNGPTAAEVTAAQEIALRQHEGSLNSNSYWLFWLLDSYKSLRLLRASARAGKEGLDPSHPALSEDPEEAARWVDALVAAKSLEFENRVVGTLTCEVVRDLIVRCFDLERHVVMMLKPEGEAAAGGAPDDAPSEGSG